jgi:hypothetical protein
MKALPQGVLSLLLQGLEVFEKSAHETSSHSDAMTFGFAHRLGQTLLAANSVPFMKYPG